MTKEERHKQLDELEEKAKAFLIAKNKRKPELAKYIFFDKKHNWLCHRTKKGKEIFCPYFWKCFEMIEKEKHSEEYSKDNNDEHNGVNRSKGDEKEEQEDHLQNDF
jgi:hypothetical protein